MERVNRVVRLEIVNNPNIEVGDKVRIVDYSYITEYASEKDTYGLHTNSPIATIIEVNVDTSIYLTGTRAVLQDVVIEIEGKQYRGLSRFLRKIRTPKQIVQDRLSKEVADKERKEDNLHSVGEIMEIVSKIDLLNILLAEIKNEEV